MVSIVLMWLAMGLLIGFAAEKIYRYYTNTMTVIVDEHTVEVFNKDDDWVATFNRDVEYGTSVECRVREIISNCGCKIINKDKTAERYKQLRAKMIELRKELDSLGEPGESTNEPGLKK